MKVIHKYDLGIRSNIHIPLPVGAEILCVQTQNGFPRLWVLVDNGVSETETRHFDIYGTGQTILEYNTFNYKYIGTFQILSVDYVGHLFERLVKQDDLSY